ncbi:hypothetical protein ABZ570_09550 [Micromonospora sp. NPDC007271]|uniref:hypothetical protein n=1 Tax=Micromonospora sp. NPDC007271 TaxID=3154587 RepID=UPI0033FB82E3
MDKLTAALAELDAGELDVMVNEFYRRAEMCLEVGQDGWAKTYAAIACAAVDALGTK